jgi:thymidylate kinase
MAQGKLIVFEGPDNCGKTTQLALVAEEFARVVKEKDNKEITYKIFKFPRSHSFYGKLIYHMLYNIDKNYSLDTIENINLFAQLQLDDKLEMFKEISNLLEECDYIFLDRFTLSSRIYDAASYYLLNTKVDISFLKNNQNPNNLHDFLEDWVFTKEFNYLNVNLREKFKYLYNILNHSFFAIQYVLFKSCPTLERISCDERPPDQYERGTFKEFISIIYDYIASIVLTTEEIMDNPIIVDTTEIVKKVILSFDHNHIDEYSFCKEKGSLSRHEVTRYIVEKLYERFKDK